jgi:tetratricopeptide (TPR) repeat protein/transcriptional regulator with XRE-family HTH domain
MPAEGTTSDTAGSWLRRQRQASGLTQEELAARSGLSVRAISDLERGRTRRPYPRTIRLLTEALRVPGKAARHDQHADHATVPRQLPAPIRHFAGRERELGVLSALLDGAGQAPGPIVISAVSGTAGIGKTTLAVHWAHRVAERFPDGQLYVNLRGFDPTGTVVTPGEAVRRFLDALDVPAQRIPADLDGQTALYRTLLADRRVLVVLDNARDADQIRPLLPAGAGCLALVTSRNQLTPLIATEDAHLITLGPLSADEALALLTQRLGGERVNTEPEATDAIIARSARLPLALAIVAAHAAAHPRRPLRTLADALSGGGTGLDALSAGDPTTDVRTVFSWSYRTLTPDAAGLFRLLGLHPGPDVSAAAAASLAAVPAGRVQPLLTELTQANLIAEPAPDRYALHDLLHAYAADLARTHDTDEQSTTTGRLLDHYLHTAHAADRLLYPARNRITLTAPRPGVLPEELTDQRQAMDWFVAEASVLLAVLDHAATTRFDTHTWQLTWTLSTFLDQRGRWTELVGVGGIALTAAERLSDPTAEAHAHTTIACAHTRLRHFDDAQAHLECALDRYGRTGDRIAQAHTHHNLGYLADVRGGHATALDHTRQALDLFRAAGHLVGQANTLNAIGWCYAQMADLRQTLVHCRQALSMLKQLEDFVGQAHTWDSIGYAHRHLGEHTAAIASYQQAVDLYQRIGDRNGEATTLTRLGDTHHDAGDADLADKSWQQALAILDDLAHPDADTVRAKLQGPAR